MLSPDRKWVWDGRQWLPVADPNAPAHQGVFKAFDVATKDLPPPVVDVRPVPVQMPYTVSRPAKGKQQPQPLGVLWDRPKTGLNRYLYIAAGGLVAVIALVLVLQYVEIGLPTTSAVQSPRPTASPVPALSARSDAARADRYMNGILFPALNNLNDTLTPVARFCHTVMTTVCGAAVPPADRDMKAVLKVMDSTTGLVPGCISAGVAGMRRDLGAMDVNLVGASTAFDNNDTNAVRFDLNTYRASLQLLANDEKLTTQTLQPACTSDVTGP